MFAKSSVLFLTAVVTGACAAHIPTIYNYGTVSAAEHLHHVESHQFLVTDITKPSTKAAFVANFFSNSCNNGFLGQVTGSGGANCVQSISGTKGIALISQPDGCAGKSSRLIPSHSILQLQKANILSQSQSTRTQAAPIIRLCSFLDNAFRRQRLESHLTPSTESARHIRPRAPCSIRPETTVGTMDSVQVAR